VIYAIYLSHSSSPPRPRFYPQREDLRIKHGYYALWRRPGGSGWFPAHFICTAILRFLYRPRIILTAPSPQTLSLPIILFDSRPWPSRFNAASRPPPPCQDVKAVVKRRASAINHSRSRYYARNPRVGWYMSRWAGAARRDAMRRYVYMTFLSAIANPRLREFK